ncbi:MAG: hypothetical protein LBH03_03105 [Holophagales bacterium]|jgi:hypothetical protein|nr:hypothetical protein [Holophagales bacterium]
MFNRILLDLGKISSHEDIKPINARYKDFRKTLAPDDVFDADEQYRFCRDMALAKLRKLAPETGAELTVFMTNPAICAKCQEFLKLMKKNETSEQPCKLNPNNICKVIVQVQELQAEPTYNTQSGLKN